MYTTLDIVTHRSSHGIMTNLPSHGDVCTVHRHMCSRHTTQWYTCMRLHTHTHTRACARIQITHTHYIHYHIARIFKMLNCSCMFENSWFFWNFSEMQVPIITVIAKQSFRCFVFVFYLISYAPINIMHLSILCPTTPLPGKGGGKVGI